MVPALIRRFDEAVAAHASEVACWGTGKPTRDLLYVDDAARGIVLAAELLDDPLPVNLGSGREISIGALAQAVATLCGFQGRVRWDSSKPDGHPRRLLDVTRARRLFDFSPEIPFGDGLRRTLEAWRARDRLRG